MAPCSPQKRRRCQEGQVQRHEPLCLFPLHQSQAVHPYKQWEHMKNNWTNAYKHIKYHQICTEQKKTSELLWDKFTLNYNDQDPYYHPRLIGNKRFFLHFCKMWNMLFQVHFTMLFSNFFTNADAGLLISVMKKRPVGVTLVAGWLAFAEPGELLSKFTMS